MAPNRRTAARRRRKAGRVDESAIAVPCGEVARGAGMADVGPRRPDNGGAFGPAVDKEEQCGSPAGVAIGVLMREVRPHPPPRQTHRRRSL